MKRIRHRYFACEAHHNLLALRGKRKHLELQVETVLNRESGMKMSKPWPCNGLLKEHLFTVLELNRKAEPLLPGPQLGTVCVKWQIFHDSARVIANDHCKCQGY